MSILTLITAAAVGGIDGVGASADHSAGRSWDSPGMTEVGVPLLNWGYAPVIQSTALAAGTVGVLASRGSTAGDIARGAALAGTALISRGLAFKFAQRSQSSPAPVQGYRG